MNSQRAIRTNDIMNVGVTARHHTFFEMLGNFSIGDYFKKEAIQYAYDLLVNHFTIDPALLYITVYEKDQEAYQHWIDLRIDPSHILKGNKERNFWDIGSGPCGPCTEIYYDRGNKYDSENIGVKLFQQDIENDRYVEIWNIVFSEFNNDGAGNYTELARKNIDTGAGLERLATISQQVPTDFDTDIFLPVIQAISKLTDKRYEVDAYFSKDVNQLSINRDFKIIADHLKACTFAIADGAVPSNKERGSVLRRLIRRAMISARRLGIKQNFSAMIVPSIILVMQPYYSYLIENENRVIQILTKEEELFNQTLEYGFKLFDEVIAQKNLNIDNIFRLVDTYGFPFELIVELAKERGIEIDETAYERRLGIHQDVSRANLETKAMAAQNKNLLKFTQPSIFNYNQVDISAKIIGLFDKNFTPIKILSDVG
jgi:alanyl-tRNA synthetase